jgi:hypothetical protein
MSITPSTRKTRPVRANIALLSVVSLGLLGGSVALAAPAEAKTSERGCTVEPLKPKLLHEHDKKDKDRNGPHKVDFRIFVDCNGNKKVDIRQKRFEDDHNDRNKKDDLLGKSRFTEMFRGGDKSITIKSEDKVKDRKGDEKAYHEVSFRVRTGNNWSDWTQWEKSDVLKIEDHKHR